VLIQEKITHGDARLREYFQVAIRDEADLEFSLRRETALDS